MLLFSNAVLRCNQGLLFSNAVLLCDEGVDACDQPSRLYMQSKPSAVPGIGSLLADETWCRLVTEHLGDPTRDDDKWPYFILQLLGCRRTLAA